MKFIGLIAVTIWATCLQAWDGTLLEAVFFIQGYVLFADLVLWWQRRAKLRALWNE